jgi:hypothetical protein
MAGRFGQRTGNRGAVVGLDRQRIGLGIIGLGQTWQRRHHGHRWSNAGSCAGAGAGARMGLPRSRLLV